MNEDIEARKREGQELLADHLKKTGETAEAFLSTLKGFRRDLGLSTETFPDNITAEFVLAATGLVMPPMQTAGSFSDLSKALVMCHSVLDGKIKLKNPKVGPNQELREKMLEETRLAHKNLMDVAEKAQEMYKSIQNAGFEFDVFNSKNIDAKRTDLNILFDRDAVYVGAATARALGERAIRLDIDLVESIQGLETGQKEVTV